MNRELIAYLLHENSEEERLAFSERWMSDADLHEQLRMAEAELLDAYVRDDLGPERRERIEKYLLASPAQQEKLAFARMIQKSLPRERRSFPWLAVAAAASIAILAGAAFWLIRENGTLHRQILEARTSINPAPGPIVNIRLANDSVRGATKETSLTIPPGADLLHLELELDPADQSPSASVEFSIAGRVIWTQAPVPERSDAGRVIAALWIPASLLAPGRYEIKLASNGSALAYYHLNVAPK